MKHICHSDGCPGADMAWENEGKRYGVETIAYSFRNHIQESMNPKILTVEELAEGWEHVKIADKTLKKNVESLTSPYMRNLLCRNWFQVKNADAIFAVGKFGSIRGTVDGGTGWAVQMAVDNKKPVYFFDQTPPTCNIGGAPMWSYYDYKVNLFIPLTYCPSLPENFAGIGTRDLNEYGKSAIWMILHTNLAHSSIS
jgi:hypothetical protein